MRFEQINEGIYRLCVPFENIYTSVFLLMHGDHRILVDCATTKDDVEEYIIPALKQMNIVPTYQVCSHMHGDHCGGLSTIMQYYPEMTVGLFSTEPQYAGSPFYHFKDGELLADRYKMINLPGHCEESLAVFDTKTKSLLTFDSLQMFGVGRYGTIIGDLGSYKKSIQKVRILAPENIIAAHEYIPHGFQASGEKEVRSFLDQCEEAVGFIKKFADKYAQDNDEQVAALYHREYPELPPIGWMTVQAVRNEEET